ncbi:hypothetical protein NCAS_0E01880 [Naumovozyma castellii]|uniref:Uncharacterized protein n=1 Tax=Naumovozyma castellii TaxID=27288 RepID=G0VFJ2_NAUCA|nr:hypothetical protein NCAS_0E01880 [Naumovozyma castellii CBS 4309]CCC70258.1 hypothetical protein NCAS_0E01880 [Naumovozyma castellii CBS 4309]
MKMIFSEYCCSSSLVLISNLHGTLFYHSLVINCSINRILFHSNSVPCRSLFIRASPFHTYTYALSCLMFSNLSFLRLDLSISSNNNGLFSNSGTGSITSDFRVRNFEIRNRRKRPTTKKILMVDGWKEFVGGNSQTFTDVHWKPNGERQCLSEQVDS